MLDKLLIGKRIKELRNNCGLSQGKLAQMLNISYQAISKWETGISLPDTELILPISNILGVTSDYLLGGDRNDFYCIKHWLPNAYNADNEGSKVLSAISQWMTKEDLYTTALMIEEEEISLALQLTVNIKQEGKNKTLSKDIPLSCLDDNTVTELAQPLTELIVKALNKSDYGLQKVLPLMRCPQCGEDLTYQKVPDDRDGKILRCSRNHVYNIIDGVVDFGYHEQMGNNWSYCYKTYAEYLKYKESFDRRMYEENNTTLFKLFEELNKIKPDTIIDAGTGEGSLASFLLERINWPCTIVLTDLSHRILRYCKRYFQDNKFSSNVKIVYLACDIRKYPFKDSSVECVISFSGFLNMGCEHIKGIEEAERILKKAGSCIYDIGFVSDKKNADTQKWFNLMENDEDEDLHGMKDWICDIPDWEKINQTARYSTFNIAKTKEEKAPPDTEKFPYENEVLRWLGSGVITAVK